MTTTTSPELGPFIEQARQQTYRGRPAKVGGKKEQERAEWLALQVIIEKCKQDARYFIERFLHIEDRDAPELAVKFTLWPKQVDVLDIFIKNRLSIVLKARQLGLTWLALAYAVWRMFSQPGYAVTALSKREEDSKELVRRVKFILRHLPPWMIQETQADVKHPGQTWESTVLSVTINHPGKEPSVFTSMTAAPDSGRSFTASLVILDEWCFQQWAREIWTAAYPTVNRPTGGQVIGLSTAKRGTLFEEIWDKACEKLNSFTPIFLPWSADPRRTQGWYEQTRADLGEAVRAEYPCVAQGSLVATNSGIIPIEEAIRATSAETGVIAGVLPKGVKDVVKIRTVAGRELFVTPDHRISTPDGFVEAINLAPGDKVTLSLPIFATEQYVLTWQNIPGYQCSMSINEDLGLFLGYFMGDGSFLRNANGGCTVDFACCAEDADVAEEVSDLCEKLTGRVTIQRLTGKNKGCINIRSNHLEWLSFLSVLGAIKKREDDLGAGRWIRNVCVPEVIFKSPRHIIRAFLSTLFEADGCIYKNYSQVMLFSKRESFLRDVQLLLLGFGINSVIRVADKVNGEGRVYIGRQLVLRSAAARRFCEEIGFRSARKIARQQAYLARKSRAIQNLDFDVVANIENAGQATVYDLLIADEPHAFGANGILVHNCTPEEAFMFSGNSVFDMEKVINRIKALRVTPISKRGTLTSPRNTAGDPTRGKVEFREDANGYLTVYREAEKGTPYVIGADTAEGGLDFSVAQVLDNTTGEQVATWRGHADTDLFAKELFMLGHYYNEALIAVETNFDLHPVKELERLGYHRQYKREVLDEISRKKQHKHGFKTTKGSRGPLIGDLVAIVRDDVDLFNDLTTLEEMLTFVRNEDGKPEAVAGKHDDCVMSAAIAHSARDQQTMKKEVTPTQITGTYAWGQLLMMGYNESKIRAMARKGQIKLIGGRR